MIKFPQRTSAPRLPSKSVVSITDFKGADTYNTATAMDIGRSPYCPNMTRSAPGKVRKRMGYELYAQYDGRVNGCFTLGEKEVIHAGTKLYADGVQVGEGMNDAISCARQYNGRLYILDGAHYWVLGEFDGEMKLKSVSETATVPTVMIDRDPVGGGTKLDDVNVLTDKFTELFFSDGKSATYEMSFDDLDDSFTPEIKLMQDDGVTWTAVASEHFTTDYKAGKITFSDGHIPPATPVAGQSNVSITVAKDRQEKRDRVEKCTFMTTFGDNSCGNRIFCSGNPSLPNWDFWCEMNDPTYFPDLSYSVLGQDDSAIVGYSVIGPYLAAHKDTADGSIYVRSAVTDENNMYRQWFPIINVIKGRGALSSRSFGYLTHEPLFLTPQGVFAITTQELTSEKYEQRRSFYIDNMLLKEPADRLKKACACVYKDLYLLSVGSTIYVLDGSTKSYQKDEPHSAYQYECFYWTDIPARVLWVHGDRLFFGTESGEVFRFYNEPNSALSYSDNGRPIRAVWQTSSKMNELFYKNKRFSRCSVQLAPATATGMTAYCKQRGVWEEQFNADTSARFLKFSALQFSKMCFTSDDAPRTITRKVHIRKVDKVAFRFINDELGEPFGLEAIAFEYVQTGNYKE